MSSAPKVSGPLEGELADYLHQIDAIKRDAERLMAGLTDNQFNWRPGPLRWSIAECISHLEIVGRNHLTNIDAAIDRARSHRLYGTGPFKYGFVETWFVHANEPPPKVRMKSPKAAKPLSFQPRKGLSTRFMVLQDELEDRVHQANGLDLARTRVNSPFVRVFRMSLGSCLAFLTAHERRHVWQAGQVRAHPDFPAA
jgi:hypothetical protein